MDGWMIMVRAGVCTTGVLLFLRTVALGVRRVELDLQHLEREERKSYQQRLEADIYVAKAVPDAELGN